MADPRSKEGATLTLDASGAGEGAEPGRSTSRRSGRRPGEMERDGRVFVIGEDSRRFGGAFQGHRGLFARFGAGA